MLDWNPGVIRALKKCHSRENLEAQIHDAMSEARENHEFRLSQTLERKAKSEERNDHGLVSTYGRAYAEEQREFPLHLASAFWRTRCAARKGVVAFLGMREASRNRHATRAAELQVLREALGEDRILAYTAEQLMIDDLRIPIEEEIGVKAKNLGWLSGVIRKQRGQRGLSRSSFVIRDCDPEFRIYVPEFMVIPCDIAAEPSLRESALEQITRELPAERYVIRSSAPVEDGAKANWAGRFESVACSRDDVAAAAETVVRSASSEKAREYARQHGIAYDGRMGVIVMEEVAGLKGTLYSRNGDVTVQQEGGFDNDSLVGCELRDVGSEIERAFGSPIDLEDVLATPEPFRTVHHSLRLTAKGLFIEKEERQRLAGIALVQVRPLTEEDSHVRIARTGSGARARGWDAGAASLRSAQANEPAAASLAATVELPAYVLDEREVLDTLTTAWHERPQDIRGCARRMASAVRHYAAANPSGYALVLPYVCGRPAESFTKGKDFPPEILNTIFGERFVESLPNLRGIVTYNEGFPVTGPLSHAASVMRQKGLQFCICEPAVLRRIERGTLTTGDTIRYKDGRLLGITDEKDDR